MYIIMMTLAVSDLMRQKVDTIEESRFYSRNSKKMKDEKVSSLLVIDRHGNCLLLMITLLT